MDWESKYKELLDSVHRCMERAEKHFDERHVTGGRIDKNAKAACTWIYGELKAVTEKISQ